MFPLSPSMWGAIIVGVLILGLGTGLKIQTDRLTTSKAETVAVQAKYDAFVAQERAIGEIQIAKVKATEAANQSLKEKVDETSAKARADLAALYAKYARVRNGSGAGSNSGGMPEAPAVTSSAPRTCFDTAQLAGAMGILEAGVPRITEQGDVARLRLSSAAEWAASLAK